MPLNETLLEQLDAGKRSWQKRNSLRPANVSVKGCLRCGAIQERQFVVVGPFNRYEIPDLPNYEVVKPKRSNHPFWRAVGLRWLVCPPDYSLLDGWFTTDEMTRCRKCSPDKLWVSEKKTVRKFGLTALIIMRLKSRLFENFTFNSR